MPKEKSLILQTFADYLKVKGYDAEDIPLDVSLTPAIRINNDQIPYQDLHQSKYGGLYREYLGRLNKDKQ